MESSVLNLRVPINLASRATTQEGATAKRKVVQGKLELQKCRPGPWGTIEYFTTQLQPPTWLLKKTEPSDLAPRWVFTGMTEQKIEQLLASLGLTKEHLHFVLDRERWVEMNGHIRITPSLEIVESLTPAARATLYNKLGESDLNSVMREPYFIPAGGVAEWLGTSELRPELLKYIEKLTYQRGRRTVFADEALLLAKASSDAERLDIRRALNRTPSLMLTLKLQPDTDVEALTRYWEGGQRNKDIQAFLEGITQTAGANTLDIALLLPATPRKLLHTFPNISSGLSGHYPDCHWSSLNFFNYEPLDRLADPSMAAPYVLQNYRKTTDAKRFGDVLFFMDGSTGNAMHSCVYICDDIVFTKNGRSLVCPWVLAKLDDVLVTYESFFNLKLETFRRITE